MYISKPNNTSTVEFRVSTLKDIINVILPHFDSYPLITQKFSNYILFKQVVLLMLDKEHNTLEGVQKIVNIRASLNLGISKDLKEAFPRAVPVKFYPNSDISKVTILSENKAKSGIYMWTNLTNGKCYIGSAVDLSDSIKFYYSSSKMNSALQQGKNYICSALLKDGNQNFSLTILEYCEPSELLKREKYYIDYLQSEYNIVKDPTVPPMSGRTHSEETRKKISDTAKKIDNYGRFKTGENNPMFGKNHSEETILKISEAKMGKNLSDEVRKKMSDTAKKIDNPGRFKAGENHSNYGKPKLAGSGTPAQAIEVFDNKTNQTTNFESIDEAARILDIRWEGIKNYLARNQQKPYKGRYNFTLKK